MKHISHKIVDLWHGPIGFLWLLWPLELAYISFIQCRRLLYRIKFLPIYRPPCPVIVIGNLSVGGVGKTPVVIELVKKLQNLGYMVGVVSRGYGAVQHDSQPLIVDSNTRAAVSGDEPILIYEKTKCPVAVHRSRAIAAKFLTEKHSIDLIISDDGLQHYALYRDLEVVLIDSDRELGNRHCLPVGPLREVETRLSEVDIVLRRGGNDSMSISYVPGDWKKISGPIAQGSMGSPGLSSVHAIAGIGQPEQFFLMLEEMGFNPVRFSYPDHHQFEQKDFERHSGHVLVMTEKDAVKCRNLEIPEAWVLEICVQLPEILIERVVELVRVDEASDKFITNNETVS